MNKMRPFSRIMIACSSLALIGVYFLPVWFIFLIAPQYPEGLTMRIWLDRISGQVDIINGLNHYIGMKHIQAAMFPELSYLVYVVAFFILFGLVVASTGKRKLLFVYLVLTIIGGASAMIDFYRWGYDYGHNLDPKAPIQVPGLYYQPPLIGHKTLLNFDAYSFPDSGGWLVIGVGTIIFMVATMEWLRNRKKSISIRPVSKKMISIAATFLAYSLVSCNTAPQPFALGKDHCDECSMTIMDPKFGGEILTKKGRLYRFDDAHCLAQYIKKGKIRQEDISRTVFINYDNNKQFLDVKSILFVMSSQLQTPMNGHAAAFSTKAAAEKKAKELSGQIMEWPELYKSF
ncbi:MAG: nitrous oxide reductase accessory protein NosL [Flavisolibacter sp.]